MMTVGIVPYLDRLGGKDRKYIQGKVTASFTLK